MTSPTNSNLLYDYTDSPIGPLLLVGDGRALRGLYMASHHAPPLAAEWRRAREPFATAIEQLEQYFAGERLEFDLPLEPAGSPFQRQAWLALREIPYGETRTYGEQARRMGRPTAARAVGMANGRNPLSIVVPCHRVVGHDGSLTGFGGGLDRKRYLLAHEASVVARRGR